MRLAILAGSHAAAQEFAGRRGMRSNEWFWPRDVEHAESVAPVEVYVLPSFDAHDYWPGLAAWFARQSTRPVTRWKP